MQNNDSEKACAAADRDDEASSNDGAAEEAVGDRDDEVPSPDGAEETVVDCENDDPSRGAESTVAERDDEDASRDVEQAAAVTGADRDDRDCKEARKPVKKGDCVWTMYLPSTSGKETLVANNNYGCEHYKRKSKFVVSSKIVVRCSMAFSTSSDIIMFICRN